MLSMHHPAGLVGRDEVLLIFCMGWPGTVILPSSWIVSMSHWAWLRILKVKTCQLFVLSKWPPYLISKRILIKASPVQK
jgi:hypothetical protein